MVKIKQFDHLTIWLITKIASVNRNIKNLSSAIISHSARSRKNRAKNHASIIKNNAIPLGTALF